MSDTIRDYEYELLEKEQIRKELERKMTDIKISYEAQALYYASKKDADFSNEAKRKVAIDNWLKENDDYMQMFETVEQLKVDIRKLEIEIQFEKREFWRDIYQKVQTIGGVL